MESSPEKSRPVFTEKSDMPGDVLRRFKAEELLGRKLLGGSWLGLYMLHEPKPKDKQLSSFELGSHWSHIPLESPEPRRPPPQSDSSR